MNYTMVWVRRRAMSSLTGVFLLAQAASCSSSDPPVSNDAGAEVVDTSRVSRVLGAAGGTLTLGGASLVVPPGAVSEDTLLTVTVTGEAPPDGYVAWSPVYRFSPAGLRFARPVEVRIPFDGDASRAGVYWTASAGEGYERRPGVVIGNVAVASVDHFSLGFVGDERADAGRDGGLDASAPDAPDAPDAPAPDAPAPDAPAPDVFDAATEVGADALVDLGADSVPVIDTPRDLPVDLGGGCATGCAPRPIAPASLSTLTSRRPTLRWALSEGTDGAHADLCRDRAMTVGCVALDATGARVAPTADLAVGRWFWRLRGRVGSAQVGTPGPIWQFTVPARTAPVDSAWASGLDADGDGFADLAVGSPASAVVYVYNGSSTGIPASPTATLVGPPGSLLGGKVASAGDVNGDGYSDLLATSSTGTNLYLGGATGFNPTAAATLAAHDGTFLGALGDIDGDGYGDLAFNGQIIPGAAAGIRAAAARRVGSNLRPAGDVNGDGYADAAVGPLAFEGGATGIHLGGASGLAASPVVTLTNPFGRTIYEAVGVGDLNGDGLGDLSANDDAGHAMVYLGGAAGPGATASQVVMMGGFGIAGLGNRGPFGVGDVNGDGYGDLAVPMNTEIRVFAGTAAGVRTDLPLSTSACVYNVACGPSAVLAGDLNGDGAPDMATGAYPTEASARTDVVAVYYGTAAGFGAASTTRSEPSGFGNAVSAANAVTFLVGAAPSAAYICYSSGCVRISGDFGSGFGATVAAIGDGGMLVGNPTANRVSRFTSGPTLVSTVAGNAGAEFGAALSALGDVNGDGRLDFVVGAPGESRAYVYLAGATGYPSAPSATLAGPAGSRFGAAVAAAGDVNGDRFNDVLVGAPNGAAAYVFLGGAGGVSTTPASTLSGPAGSRFGAALTTLRDTNADGFFDVMVGAPGAATAYVYRGAASGALGAPAAVLTGPAGSEFGASVTVLWGIGTTRALHPVVGAPGSAQVFAYAVSSGAVATTPVWTGAGAAGSRFGAAVSGMQVQPLGTGDSDSLLVTAPATGAVFLYTRLCTGAGCPAPGSWGPGSLRSPFGGSIASRTVALRARAS